MRFAGCCTIIVFMALVALATFPGQALAADPKPFVRQQEKILLQQLQEGKLREAEKTVQGILEHVQRNDPNDHLAFGAAYIDAANVCEALNQYDRSLDYGQKALREWTIVFGAGVFQLAEPLLRIGNAQFRLGRFREAEQSIRQALALREREFGVRSEKYAAALSDLANVLSHQGKYADSAAMQQRVLSTRVALHGPNAAVVGDTLYNIGHSMLMEWRHDDAYGYFTQAMKIYEKVYPPLHPRIVDAHVNLGRVTLQFGRLEIAERHIKTALAGSRLLHGENDPYVQDDGDLEQLYYRQGRYAEAEEIARKQVERKRKNPGDLLSLAIDLGYLGVICTEQEKFAEAEKYFAETFELAAKEEAPLSLLFQWHLARGMNHFLRKQPTKALADFREAIRYGEQQRQQFSGGTVEQAESFRRLRTAYDSAGMILLAFGKYDQAIDMLERGRTRGLFDQMASAHANLFEGLPAVQAESLRSAVAAAEQAVKAAEKAVQEKLESIAPQTPPEERTKTLQPLRQRLAAARFQLADANAAITNASPVYRKALAREFAPVSLQQLSAWCQKTETLLLYYSVTEGGTFYAYIDPQTGTAAGGDIILTAEQAAVLGVEADLLTAAKTIALMRTDQKTGLIDVLKNIERKPQDFERAINQLTTLCDVLLPNVVGELMRSGSVKWIAIIPQAGLAYLPFEALVTNHTGAEQIEYLLDVAPPILYASSATLIMRLSEQQPPKNKPDALPVLTVGDPAYDATGDAATTVRSRSAAANSFIRAGGKLDRLPFSGEESKAVAAAFGKHKIGVGQLLGTKATEASVRLNAAGRKVLHLACHGMASANFGNAFGALALAVGQRASTDAADDGFLTVAEIYPLDLRHCEIAILSACTTNIGPHDGGEGVWAISRAFLVAGARRVVASFWEVNDHATAVSIGDFCQRIAAGQEKGDFDYAAALHEAKRALRNDPKGADLALWAPFVLVGPQ